MPSAKELRELAEVVSAYSADNTRSPSPFIEAIHAPAFARRRNAAQLKEVHVGLFENLEPFLPFGKPKRQKLDSPPLSPWSKLTPDGTQPDLWFLGHSVRMTNSDARELVQELASNSQRYGNVKGTGDTARRTQVIGDRGTQDAGSRLTDSADATSKRISWHTDETYLMSGALLVASNCSSWEHDEAPTPKYSQDRVAPKVRGGGEETDPTAAFLNSAEEWNTWVHHRYPSPPSHQVGKGGDSKPLEPDQEPATFISDSEDLTDHGPKGENVDGKTWTSFGNVYFHKHDDDLFEYDGNPSDNEKIDTSTMAGSKAVNLKEKGCYSSVSASRMNRNQN